MSSAVEAFSAALKNADWRVRKDAVEHQTIVGDERAMPGLLSGLHDADAWVASSAVHSLSAVAVRCDRSSEVRVALLRALDNDREKVRRSAAHELSKARWLADPEVGARLAIFYAQHGTTPPPMTFRHCSEDGTIVSEEEMDLDDLVAEMEEHLPEIEESLLAQVREEDPWLVRSAVIALARRGTRARRVQDFRAAFRDALNSRHRLVRESAATALAEEGWDTDPEITTELHRFHDRYRRTPPLSERHTLSPGQLTFFPCSGDGTIMSEEALSQITASRPDSG